MSLNRQEQRTTSGELRANLTATGLTAEQVATDLEWSLPRLQRTLAIDASSSPVDVWELRDYLVETVRELGAEDVPFSILTERMRPQARRWFPLRRPPRHVFQPDRGQ